MGKIIEAIYEKGVFRPKKPVNLEEGQMVRIVLPEGPSTYKGQIDKSLRRHFGSWNSGNPDSANNDSIDSDLENEYANSHERESFLFGRFLLTLQIIYFMIKKLKYFRSYLSYISSKYSGGQKNVCKSWFCRHRWYCWGALEQLKEFRRC